jgi:hypothetical protein
MSAANCMGMPRYPDAMSVVEEFTRRVLNVDRELTALDYFEVYQHLTPVEREALWLAYKAEEQRNAPRDWGPFELFE